jgi:hypothetical protein
MFGAKRLSSDSRLDETLDWSRRAELKLEFLLPQWQ